MKLAVNTVTLRAKTPEEIVSILKDINYGAVEWAGDVHVPPGDAETARKVKDLSEKAGIEMPSYGAYYQCDEGGPGKGPFVHDLGADAAMESALALGTPAIRVWAGRQASAEASSDYRDEVTGCLRAFCTEAKSHGMTVHLEFHRNTLTDTAQSAVDLIEAVDCENLYSYWQPRHGVDVEGNLADIALLGDRLSNVHVFHWLLKEPGGFAVDRRPLEEGRDRWVQYISALKEIPGERYAMMEFVREDSMEQFAEDVEVLRSLV